MGKLDILIRLVRYTINYKWTILLLIFLGLINVTFGVLRPLPIKYVIDNVLSDNPLPSTIQSFFLTFGSIPDKAGLLIAFVIVTILLVVGSSVLSFVSAHITTKVCQRLVYDLSAQLFNKMQRLSLAFYSKNKVGELMQRLSGDTYAIYSIVGGIILPTLFSIATLSAMFYIMARIDLTLALLSISVVPVYAILLMVFKKPISESAQRQYEESGKLWSFMQQTLSSIKIIQAYARESYTDKIYKNHVLQQNDASVNSTRIATIYNTLTGVLSGITSAIVVGIGAYKGLGGDISIGDLFVFIGYIGALFGPVNSLAGIVQTALTIAVRGKRIFEIMDSEEEIYEKPGAIELTHVKGNVQFKNISFGYGKRTEESHKILNNFSFEAAAGKTIAIVGPTGAGKTSMISLLLRFYDPWEGEILLDGYNLKDLRLKSLRNKISLVLQDALIFPTSLAENIAFGDPTAAMDEIMKAAKMAQAHDFIMRLPEGYETVASEGGVSLSGGEKQRISLARAFLRNSPLLILDEPTSAMDVQTESKIFSALSEYSSGRTVFIISHRLSTIKHADMILIIKDGIIAEKGTHEALIEQGKVYSEFYNFQ